MRRKAWHKAAGPGQDMTITDAISNGKNPILGEATEGVLERERRLIRSDPRKPF